MGYKIIISLCICKAYNQRHLRNIDHYNLDVIIALGYRVQSPIAVRFRRWATQRLHEYIQKGFTMDDERLKQGGNLQESRIICTFATQKTT